ncbi:MAG: hypothetical protein R2911_35030 [Caldilineaceae bacterium]
MSPTPFASANQPWPTLSTGSNCAPKEGGRQVLVRRTADGQTTDVTASYNVRTRVHEYGGGAYAVAPDAVYFSNFADQRLYRQAHGEAPQPITPETQLRYADYVVDHRRHLLFGVREDHRGPGEAVNTLVTVKCDGDEAGGQVLAAGNDFYSSPRLSPRWLATGLAQPESSQHAVGWLRICGLASERRRLPGHTACGGRLTESIFQPEWSPDGVSFYS